MDYIHRYQLEASPSELGETKYGRLRFALRSIRNDITFQLAYLDIPPCHRSVPDGTSSVSAPTSNLFRHSKRKNVVDPTSPLGSLQIKSRSEAALCRIDGLIFRLDNHYRSDRTLGFPTSVDQVSTQYSVNPVPVAEFSMSDNDNVVSEGVYQDVRRQFKSFGSRSDHLDYIFGVQPNPDFPGKFDSNWFDRRRSDMQESVLAPYFDDARRRCASARASVHRSNIHRETFERLSMGWFPVFVTLTASPERVSGIFYDRDHPDYGTHWTVFKRRLQAHCAKAVYGVADPRYRHDPKYLVQSKSISDPDERSHYLNKSIPISDYFSSICIPEVGKKSGRPHFHALVFMRDFTASDPNFANYRYRMCTHKIKCSGGQCKQYFSHKQIKVFDRMWPLGTNCIL